MMDNDVFDELVKRKFADFERQNGRVPTISELAKTLEVDPKVLETKLKKAFAKLAVDAQTEGNTAFQSSLQEIFSFDLMQNGVPGESDLRALQMKATHSKSKSASLEWILSNKYKYSITVEIFGPGFLPRWTLWDMSGSKPIESCSYHLELEKFLDYLEPYKLLQTGTPRSVETPQVDNVIQFKKKSE